MKILGGARSGLAAALCVIGVASAAIPAAAGAIGPAGAAETTLVFANGKTRGVAGNVAVPVQCLGSGGGFCSGQVTLSRNGHHASIPFSVRAGGEEVLFVPLRLVGAQGHPRKVHGVATTIQALGPVTRTAEFLYAE